MKTLKLAIATAILALGFNVANAQVHIGVSFGYPARPVYYHPYYRPVVVERPVYYEQPAPVYEQPAPVVVAPAYPVYYRHHGYGYYRRPVVYRHVVYRRW
ncbi:hypothetical protein ACFS5N_01035 [Mucilaginibacter ximonensis]|uniref:PXPV repeat-containing protein n=1 Tax=Mucilaginibacter ximonensis TaxID=538021 RepID=A0ABW5Y6Q0_9SPHI